MITKKSLPTIISLLLLFFSNIIFATTYYVSLTGDDSNDGTISSPYRTIAYGVSVLTAGDTLIIKDGDYGNENVEITQSGTAANPIIIKAENIGQAILNGPRLANEWDSDCGTGIFIINELMGLKHITISGLYVKNYAAGIYGEGDDGMYHSNILIKDCILENNTGDGVAFWKVNNVTIKNCTFISGIPDGISPPIIDDFVIQDYGIGLYFVNNSLLKNNYFFGTQAQAISYKYGCHGGLITKNIFEGTVSASVFLGQRSNETQEYCSDLKVKKNIFRNAQGYELETPIRIDVVENVEVLYNYLEGFASHSEEYGIHFEISSKGIINVHDNIIAFGTIANEASGSHIDYGVTTNPTINYHHNTFYKLSADVNGDLENVNHSYTDNLSYQCVYYDETGAFNYIGDPNFIDGDPIKQTEANNPTLYDFDSYYTQLITPFKLSEESAAIGYGFRFDLASTVNEIINQTFEIYPNPANDNVTIKTETTKGRINIFNQLGQKVLTKKTINNKLDVSKLKSGVYFVILDVQGKRLNKRFISVRQKYGIS